MQPATRGAELLPPVRYQSHPTAKAFEHTAPCVEASQPSHSSTAVSDSQRASAQALQGCGHRGSVNHAQVVKSGQTVLKKTQSNAYIPAKSIDNL